MAYQTFTNTMVPFSIVWPLYTSSWSARRGTVAGQAISAYILSQKDQYGDPHKLIGAFSRNISAKTASTYGRLGLSETDGRRSVPMMRSTSSCAFLRTSGCFVMKARNAARMIVVCIAVYFVSHEH